MRSSKLLQVKTFGTAMGKNTLGTPGGFAPVLWHPKHKTNQDEWSRAVLNGKLTGAIQALKPSKRRGPFTVLCNGEGFLRARKSMQAYRRKNVSLWTCLPKSPDLNPVEMFWGWLRKKCAIWI